MKNFTLLLLVLFTTLTWSQNYKFGKVSKEELEESFYPLDSSANAAILYSERETHFDYIYDKGFYIVENYFSRIKIYNKEGYDNATKDILTFHNSNGKEVITHVKAVTYNLENGKVVKTNLKKKNVFNEKKSRYYDSNKFTMPNLKPGCVIEWEYTFESPFIGALNEVKLQDEIPIKKLTVKISSPEYLVYNTKSKGYLPIPMQKDRKSRTVSYTYHDMVHESGGYKNVSGMADLNFEEYINRVELKDIPAIKKEPLSGNISNYKSGILFELSYTKYPNSPTNAYSKTWEVVVDELFKSDSFGGQITKDKHFEEELTKLLIGLNNTNEKIGSIYQFVKSKIKWNGIYEKYSLDGLKKAYKDGVGNAADINLNLVSMLRFAGLDANPVLVSTINNGVPLFPTRNGFNYVIARVGTPNGFVLLDATEKNALPDVLPERVLNFQGRVVRKNGDSEWVELFPKKHSIYDTKISSKFDGEGFSGTSRKTITNNFSLEYRNVARGSSKESLLEWVDQEKEGIDVLNARVSNLNDLGKDVVETIQFETESFYEDIGDKTYISPLLYLQMEENVFKSEKREFPVFYNTPWAEMLTVNISIPQTYSIESIPGPIEHVLPNNLGVFQYNLTSKENTIEIKSSLVINQPVINPTHYLELKEFYNKIISKHREKIVLRKN